MYATQIRPVTDLRNKYSEIDEGKGQDAFEALDEIRAELNV